jgi:ATP-dependent 26S proteasome regulatory subunit
MSILGTPIDSSDSIANLGKGKKDNVNLNSSSASEDKKKEKQMPASFVPRPPRCKLSQVVLPSSVRTQINMLLSRIRNHSLIYTTWGLSEIDPQGKHIAFNFYGPPGTGKTMCVEGLAAEIDKQIIDVSYAEIESKYVGETGKNIVAAFAAAKETDSLLFFDEADSILGKRMTNVTQAADHGVNVARAVMLKQLDDFDGIVAFATNLAKNFDNAFVRRILQHVEIPLPDKEGRLAIWKKMLSSKVPGRDNIDWLIIADKSDGLSGGEIKNAIVIALSVVADREKEKQFLETADVMTAIESVLLSKHNVGSSPKIIKEEIIE